MKRIAAWFLTIWLLAVSSPAFGLETTDVINAVALPFQARSIAILGERIFIADQSTIYELIDRQPRVWWKIPDQEEILRLYAYGDSILAVANNEHHMLFQQDDFVTYRITSGKTVKEWLGAVVPWDGGLISSVVKLAPDITKQVNRWSRASAIEGRPTIPPIGTDIIGSAFADVCPAYPGSEIITFSPSGKLIVTAHRDTIWSSDVGFVSLPLSLQQEYIVYPGDFESQDITMTQYYYLPPRIIVDKETMITIDNNAGRPDLLENAKSYTACQIRGYTWTGRDFEERIIVRSGLGYGTDIAVRKGVLMTVIVKQSGSQIIFTSYNP